MIRYTLQCAEGHRFESWFRDSAAYESLTAAGQVACSVCGSTTVEKALMAPSVGATKEDEEAPLSKPAHPAEVVLRQMRKHLKENADYVGREFADEARKIHDGESDKRHIWGETTPEEAKALNDEGVPVAPIPWMSRTDD